MARYATQSLDIDVVADRIARDANTTFEHRDSSFWGDYRLIRDLLGEADVRIIRNRDPMYRPTLDPKEDELFESCFGRDAVLIDTQHETDANVEALLYRVVEGIVRVSQPAAG